MPRKTCSKCGVEQAHDAFAADKRNADGRQSNCRDCQRRYQRSRKAANAAKQRKWRSDNRDRYLTAQRKRLALQDPEALREYHRQWRVLNPESSNAKAKRWRARNPDAVREQGRRRRAQLFAAFVAHVDENDLILRDQGRCGICGDDLYPIPGRVCFDVDHIVPLARGGTHEPDNVQLAHPLCNRRKQDRLGWKPVAA